MKSVEIKFDTFFKNCDRLAALVTSQKEDVIKALVKYETYDAACDEISRTLDTLQGVRQEFSAIHRPLSGLKIATVFPLNLPLYSLVLFGIVPGAFSERVFIRPPEVMQDMLTELWNILKINEYFPNLTLAPVPRQVFVQLYASDCDVIIFTGKYENAMNIHEQCPDTLLVYNGSGINPFLIFENADIKLAAKKAVEMRCFNSGQDCAGPDAFFVPKPLADDFVRLIQRDLEGIKVGDTTDTDVRIGPTMKQAYITELEGWIADEKEHLVYGGKIDRAKHLVYPSIIRKNITSLKDLSFHEFFAPYFYVLEYDSTDDLKHVLESPDFKKKGMYVSVFGDNDEVERSLSSVRILRNVIVNDVERGNTQYGGYGERANFLLYRGKKIVHPILISRDIHALLLPAQK